MSKAYCAYCKEKMTELDITMNPDDNWQPRACPLCGEVGTYVCQGSIQTMAVRGLIGGGGHDTISLHRWSPADLRAVADAAEELFSDLFHKEHRQGANWRPNLAGLPSFTRVSRYSETCELCGKHIRLHYGGTEYRCEPALVAPKEEP